MTRSWFALALVLAVMGRLFQLRELILLSGLMLVVQGVAWGWQKTVLRRVTYKREMRYRRAFPGEKLSLSLVVENLKFAPVPWMRTLDRWPKAVGPANEEILAPSSIPTEGFLPNVFSLKWFERVRRSYELLARERGIFLVGPAKVFSGDLFGMYEVEEIAAGPEMLVVYPAVKPLTDFGFPAEDPFGDRPSRQRLFEDPTRVMGVRDYHATDSFRRIHWPATARAGELHVKEYEPTTARNLVVCLNVATFEQHWMGTDSKLLDSLVSLSASIIYAASEDKYSVGLYANGCLAHADQPFRLPPSRSPDQLANLLMALAGVTPFVTASFDRFLLDMAPRIPYGSVLALVTAITSDSLFEAITHLQRRARRVILLAVTECEPPSYPSVVTHYLPHLRAGISNQENRRDRGMGSPAPMGVPSTNGNP